MNIYIYIIGMTPWNAIFGLGLYCCCVYGTVVTLCYIYLGIYPLKGYTICYC